MEKNLRVMGYQKNGTKILMDWTRYQQRRNKKTGEGIRQKMEDNSPKKQCTK